jgi:hypothetical protein
MSKRTVIAVVEKVVVSRCQCVPQASTFNMEDWCREKKKIYIKSHAVMATVDLIDDYITMNDAFSPTFYEIIVSIDAE